MSFRLKSIDLKPRVKLLPMYDYVTSDIDYLKQNTHILLSSVSSTRHNSLQSENHIHDTISPTKAQCKRGNRTYLENIKQAATINPT